MNPPRVPPPPDLQFTVIATPFLNATVSLVGRVIEDPRARAEVLSTGIILRDVLFVPVRIDTRRDDTGRSVPGFSGMAHPSRIPASVAQLYGTIPGCHTDPHIAAMLNNARSLGDAPPATLVSVFFPLPSALRPALEATRPQAPSTEPEAKSHALDKPSDQRGVSIKQDNGATKAPEKQQTSRADAFNPDNRVPRPSSTSDAKTLQLHERYAQARGTLEMAAVVLLERDLASDPTVASPEPGGRVVEQKLIDQILRLDSASREFFSKPGWQREAGFQRALVLSLFATGIPLEQAMKDLSTLFTGRGMVDMEQLVKLTNAYGLNELSTVMTEARLTPEMVAQKDAERLAQMQKLKAGRLPEEMLLQQQQARDAGGKKSKRGTADDRIDGVDRDRRDQHQQEEQTQEEEEPLGDDEPTHPGFVLKV